MKDLLHIMIVSTLILSTMIACNRDKITPISAECDEIITYNDHVKEIIDNTCAYSGCHLNTAPGNFDSYEGLVPYIENETFRNRVVEVRNMPPISAEDGPNELTPDELRIVLCWIQDGYIE